LGAYLFGLCLYQIGIYRWPGGPPFILDPRAGIPVLLINHFSFDNKVIYPVEWITAAWLVLMAAAMRPDARAQVLSFGCSYSRGNRTRLSH